ncbi:anti sigma factor C-terminal domain-containing protein [Breznakia pachnodae]|uniref:DUF4825 domain-containing protein n=1 Tax=Breznakia pachnodae TaxID=265178 RepID=A0ABU0E5D9_9FIRM|nr:anti sigma factor C-terminal domain-containing protein [Breznakia pachnodae]MDQ0362114.1 hypothetical protein [Breznakia pachnodae]
MKKNDKNIEELLEDKPNINKDEVFKKTRKGVNRSFYKTSIISVILVLAILFAGYQGVRFVKKQITYNPMNETIEGVTPSTKSQNFQTLMKTYFDLAIPDYDYIGSSNDDSSIDYGNGKYKFSAKAIIPYKSVLTMNVDVFVNDGKISFEDDLIIPGLTKYYDFSKESLTEKENQDWKENKEIALEELESGAPQDLHAISNISFSQELTLSELEKYLEDMDGVTPIYAVTMIADNGYTTLGFKFHEDEKGTMFNVDTTSESLTTYTNSKEWLEHYQSMLSLISNHEDFLNAFPKINDSKLTMNQINNELEKVKNNEIKVKGIILESKYIDIDKVLNHENTGYAQIRVYLK